MHLKAKHLISGCLLIVAPCGWSQAGQAVITLNPQIYSSTTTVASDMCVGLDCVGASETFTTNFTELRLKENNAMVRFINTTSQASGSLGASWLMQANDNLNGGSNSFRFLAKAFATEIYDNNGTDYLREVYTDVRISDGEMPAYDCNIGDTGLLVEPALTGTPIPIGSPYILKTSELNNTWSCSTSPAYEEELVMRLGTSARDFITLGEGSEPTPLESPGVVSVGATASLRKITNVAPPASSMDLLSVASLGLLPTEVAELSALSAAVELAESRLAALEAADADGDSVANGVDAFPNDATETTDSDSDGTGDNADAFPNDATETTDSDSDGTGDNADSFPNAVTSLTDGLATIAVTPASADSACNLASFAAESSEPGKTGIAFQGVGLAADFTLSGCDAVTPEALQVDIDLGVTPASNSKAYKILPSGVWVEILGATITGNVISYTLVDNGPYDLDDNLGAIRDPVTAAVPIVAPVPTLPFYVLLLLSGLLGLLGLRKLS
ncbi:hypothetical protein PQZ54_00995 [Luminiphilus sp.]|nr:hypothetical protein [Luminiphilus sp.]